MRLRTHHRIGRHTTLSYGPLGMLILAFGYLLALPILIPIAIIRGIAAEERRRRLRQRQQPTPRAKPKRTSPAPARGQPKPAQPNLGLKQPEPTVFPPWYGLHSDDDKWIWDGFKWWPLEVWPEAEIVGPGPYGHQ